MPRFDKTGPLGLGPRTGWGFGPCGFGWRRFWGYSGFPKRLTKEEELEVLKDEAEVLQEELKATKDRISELKGRK